MAQPADSAGMSPTLSIVIATYNAADSLQRCLDSIWGQDYERIQVVVMDGGSRDGTRSIIEGNHDRIGYWRSEPDKGIYDAWNKALDHATGDWVLFLGADDRLAGPDVLHRMARALSGVEPTTRVVYASLVVVGQDGAAVRCVGAPWEELRALLAVGLPLPHPATFHQRGLFDDVGRFDASYRISGDYELLLRELLVRPPQFVPGVVVVEMRAGGISDDPRHEALLLIENHRAQLKHGITDKRWWQTPRIIRAHIRLAIRRSLGSEREVRFVRAYRRLRGHGQDPRLS
jgi:glycosyltransferase involved in cell wall biosynthesis